MGISKQLKAAILADFVCRYNEKYKECWTIDINDYVEISWKAYARSTADGHFIKSLVEFCTQKGFLPPCVSSSWKDGHIYFFIP